MAEEAVNLVSDDEESTSSSEEELPEVNVPSCSYKRLSRVHINQLKQNETDDSSDDSSSSSESSIARINLPTQAIKRIQIVRRQEAIAKRRKLEEEREARKLQNEEMNIYKPGQCIKYICVEIHPSLASAWFMSDATRELQASGARLLGSPALPHPGLLSWTRLVPKRLTTEDGQVKLSPCKRPCGASLYIITAQELAERVAATDLLEHVDALKEMLDGELSVVVFGEFKCSSRTASKNKARVLTELEIEQIKIDLLISTGVDVQFIERPNELGLWIMQYTKAVAEAPYKKKKREVDYAATGFYMKGDNRKCVAVDREGHGLGRLWQQMISILPSSSLETARALYGKYKSPLALMNGMEQPSGVCELSELGVTRAAAPNSRQRKLGPEFARKLHLLYSSRHGNIVVE